MSDHATFNDGANAAEACDTESTLSLSGDDENVASPTPVIPAPTASTTPQPKPRGKAKAPAKNGGAKGKGKKPKSKSAPKETPGFFGGMPPATAGPGAGGELDVRAQYLTPMTMAELGPAPVVLVHALRHAGMTALLVHLMCELQQAFGIAGGLVLCDRPVLDYMNSAVPRELVAANQKPDRVLESMLKMQTLSSPRSRLVLVIDDTMCKSSTLRSEEFQRNIKRAGDLDIAILIGTTDADLLPPNLTTFATHVVATGCPFGSTVKTLHKRAFGMIDECEDLGEALRECALFEFLVGIVRSRTPCLRGLTSLLWEEGAFTVSPDLAFRLAQCLNTT